MLTNRTSGYSLMPLLAGAVIISILSLLAVPIYNDYLIRENAFLVVKELSKYETPIENFLKDIPPLDYAQVYHVPKKIHLIWLGGTMPEKYLANLQQLSALASNYQVNIFTDQSSRLANAQSFKHIENLQVRDVQKLIAIVVNGNVYTAAEKSAFMNWLNFEYMPPANYAAISDLLRVEILRQEGGLYLDLDVILNQKQIHNFALHMQELFKAVATNGGFACRRNGYITNNNIIIASNESAAALRLKALMQYMLASMSSEYLTSMRRLFANEQNYWLSKKSPVLMVNTDYITPLPAEFLKKLTYHNIPAIRILTIAHGPYKLAQLANNWIPMAKFPSAPGLDQMEKLFICYKNDNNWLYSDAKSPAEQQTLIAVIKQQINSLNMLSSL